MAAAVVGVGGTGVAVGGTGVGVAVGRRVAVDVAVAVGGTAVAVGGTGVAVGGAGVAVGGAGVGLGGTRVAVGERTVPGMAVGVRRTRVGLGVTVTLPSGPQAVASMLRTSRNRTAHLRVIGLSSRQARLA